MDPKLHYILTELWILAWNASVQRAELYRDGKERKSEQVRLFRGRVVTYLSSEIIPRYRANEIAKDQHYKCIEELIAYSNDLGSNVLGQLGYKYGIAQKLLNLALKYYWCLGEIAEPPHCPVDRIVIDKTRFKGNLN